MLWFELRGEYGVWTIGLIRCVPLSVRQRASTYPLIVRPMSIALRAANFEALAGPMQLVIT